MRCIYAIALLASFILCTCSMAGETPVGGTIGSSDAGTSFNLLDHRPGVRPLKKDAITIVDVHSNKVLYKENETATTTATLVHSAPAVGFNRRFFQEPPGMLIALMHLDLDTVKEIARTPFNILPGETKTWTFSYNVGPETYGRGIEVRYLDPKGNLVDSWREFYSVAAEYFRVHLHCSHGEIQDVYQITPWVTYMTQSHFFASEPSDFGVKTTDAEQYTSGQGSRNIHQAGRKAEMDYNKKAGVEYSFYQTWAFSGQMGYEEIRKHPEYALYDADGTLAFDPIYQSYPNPMELASPVEVGPKRKAKPHLDREYTPWQHTPVNFALEDAIVYGATCIRDYAREHGFSGIYFDGQVGVSRGYSYDGTINVPSDKPEEHAKLNARNHRIYSAILKKDNPNFGTWYNWSFDNIEDVITVYGQGAWIGSGSGSKVDFGDETIKTATDWKNVMLLYELGPFYERRFEPADFLGRLVRQRDWAVQKYGANTISGYSDTRLKGDEPGPTKWGWPSVNYVGAQFIATQTHIADAFMPSHRPTLQFMARYSRLLWAPDIKVVPDEEKLVQVSSPEEIFWKRLVYRRETKEGYDLIMHFVRIPPTEKFDINLAEEPVPLKGIKVSVDVGSDLLTDVQALRPYYFEEDQQPVQTAIVPNARFGKVSFDVPPFRYHTMLVFRIQTK